MKKVTFNKKTLSDCQRYKSEGVFYDEKIDKWQVVLYNDKIKRFTCFAQFKTEEQALINFKQKKENEYRN